MKKVSHKYKIIAFTCVILILFTAGVCIANNEMAASPCGDVAHVAVICEIDILSHKALIDQAVVFDFFVLAITALVMSKILVVPIRKNIFRYFEKVYDRGDTFVSFYVMLFSKGILNPKIYG